CYGHTVGPQEPQTFRQQRVAGSDHAAFCGRNVLVTEKTEAASGAKAATGPSGKTRTRSVSPIFDDKETVRFGEPTEVIHVGRHSCVVDGKQRFRARRYF